MEIDLIELKKLVDSGHREHVVLMDYLKFVKKIENISEIHKDIEEKYPKDKELYVELANYYINNNDVNKAISCLEKYKENDGEDEDVLVSLLRMYIDIKDFKKVKNMLDELSLKNIDEKKINDVLFNIEYSILEEGKLQNVIIDKLKKLIDSGDREHIVLMDYLKFVKKIENISEIHKDIEEKYPKDKELYVELANCYINNNDVNKAISCLEKYKENEGEDVDVLISLLRMYIDIKDFKKVKNMLDELSLKNIDEKKINDVLFNIEHSILEEGKLQNVIIDKLKKLIDSGDREHIVLMDYLKFVKKIENISEIHKDIEEKYPKDKELYVELANYYINNNDVNKAISCLEKYRQNEGDNIDVLKLLSKKYIDVKNFEKAEELLKELNKTNNEDEDINNLLDSVKCLSKEKNNIDESFIFDIEEKINNLLILSQDKTGNINEIKKIFNKNFDAIIKVLKKIFISKQKYDYYLISKLVGNFLRNLNIRKEYSAIKIFFDEIYDCVPKEQLKLKNIILNEYEISTKQIVLKSYPRTIEFALTNKCNFRCIMCNKISHSGDYSVSDKMVNDLITLMPYLQCVIVRGGEVFLDSRFGNILEQCKKNDVHMDIITNGSLLNNENINRLLDNDKIIITLSIDSLKKTIYENIRKNGSFDNLLNIIKLLNKIREEKKSKTTIGVNMVVMSINYTEIEDMIDFVGKNQFSFINLIPILHNSKYNLNNDIIKKINNNRQKYLDIAKKYNVEIFNKIPLNVDEDSSDDVLNKSDDKDDKQMLETEEQQFCVKPLNVDEDSSDDVLNKSDDKDDKQILETEEQQFCVKPFYYMLIDKNIVKPTCHCEMLEQKIFSNENMNDNTILALWNGITFCSYRKAMFSDNKYKFCSSECMKNNMLFNSDDELNN